MAKVERTQRKRRTQKRSKAKKPVNTTVSTEETSKVRKWKSSYVIDVDVDEPMTGADVECPEIAKLDRGVKMRITRFRKKQKNPEDWVARIYKDNTVLFFQRDNYIQVFQIMVKKNYEDDES